jgi:hypothetical protein
MSIPSTGGAINVKSGFVPQNCRIISRVAALPNGEMCSSIPGLTFFFMASCRLTTLSSPSFSSSRKVLSANSFNLLSAMWHSPLSRRHCLWLTVGWQIPDLILPYSSFMQP